MSTSTAPARPLVRMKQHDFLKMMRRLERDGNHRREAGAFLLCHAEPQDCDNAGAPDPAVSGLAAVWSVMFAAVRRALKDLVHLPSNITRRGGGCTFSIAALAYYKDLDPGSLTGGITFHAIGYTRLNEICRRRGLRVVADIHLHPGEGTRQSKTDADHPMVARVGHLALIAPRLGEHVVTPHELGAHVTTPGGWSSHFGDEVASVFQVRTTVRGQLHRAMYSLRTVRTRRAQR